MVTQVQSENAASAVLVACVGAAPSLAQGREAFTCWLMAKALGWSGARKLYARATWFRHRQLLRGVGLPVPKRLEAHSGPRVDLCRLLGARFVVRRTWKPDCVMGGLNIPGVADGTWGRVERLVAEDDGLYVGFVVSGDYDELPLAEFLRAVAVDDGASAAV